MPERENRNIWVRATDSLTLAFQRTFRDRRPAILNRVLPLRPGLFLLVVGFTLFLIGIIFYFDGPFIDLKRERLLGTDRIIGSWYIRRFFFWFTEIGESAWILLITALIGLGVSTSKWRALGRKQLRRRVIIYSNLNFIFFTVLISGVLSSILKGVIGRARPKLKSELGSTHFDPLNFHYDFASLPSGHATTFGALCMAIVLLFPRLKWWVLVLALLGGVSRVVVDAHYPSDVIAGLAIGAGVVVLSARWLAQRNVMFKFHGRVVPKRVYPGRKSA